MRKNGPGSLLLQILLLAFVFGSCDEHFLPTELTLPTINGIVIEANPHNAFAAVVTIRSQNSNSAFVEFESPSGEAHRTPTGFFQEGSVRIDILGLQPATLYHVRSFVSSPSGASVQSTSLTYSAPAESLQLPSLSLRSTNSPSPGFIMLGIISNSPPSPKAAALIVDNTGKPVWHRKFDGQVIDFQPQPNGNFTVYSWLDSNPPHFYEMTRGGVIIGEYAAGEPNSTDPHEVRVLGGEYYIMGEEFRSMDLTSIGGMSSATVRGITVERRSGPVSLLHWTTFDHFQITDASSDISLKGLNVNPWHGNAFDLDTDGNLLVSFRNSDVVTKINAATGAIIWRMGGKNNEFTFLNDPLNGFSHQHGIRRISNGNILLFDNGNLHTPPVSRAAEYSLDESAKTATLVWEYRGSPELFSSALGFAQRLPNGNTLICFGGAKRILEVNQAGDVLLDLAVDEPGHFPYRAFRIGSLY